jgi:pimeloyl-ACP methyl ester carboxylesterase
MSFHGGISSRLDAAPLGTTCRELGVRLIAPDRPGTGCSDDAPDRTLLDWPRDVAELADELPIERFAVMGWSLGGQYATACAYALPERVSRAALVAGVVPFEVEPSREGLSWMDRALLFTSRWAPPLAAFGLRVGVGAPSLACLQRAIERDATASDREAMRRDPGPTAMAAAIKESIRAGTRGVRRDYRIWADRWGFELERVEVEVGVWQGDADTMVPMSDAQLLAERIPRAHLIACPGEGHISLPRNRCAEIVGWLTAPHRPRI